MPIQERINKHGEVTSYRVYWNNPITKKKETRGGFKQRKDAEEYCSEIEHRIKFKPDSFKPIEKLKDEDNDVQFCQDLILLYLKEKDLAESTRKMSMHHYWQWQKIMGNPAIQDIDVDTMRKFERISRKRDVKQTTIHRRVGIIRAALNWGVREKLIPKHNLHGYKCEAGQNHKEAPPTPEEIKAMIAVSPPHLARAIKLAISLGCRVGSSELLKLEWKHFNLEEGFVYVPEAHKNKHKKRSTGRKVPLTDAVLKEVKAWKIEDDKGKRKMNRSTGSYEYDGKPIPWPIHRNGRRVTGHFKKAWHNARENAGIERKITPYDLRHAFATQLIGNTKNYKLASEIMGTNPETLIKSYQHVTEDEKRDALNSLPEVF